MKTEWDQVKRDWTLRERGLDFAPVAAARWDAALTEPDTRTGYGEDRFVSLVPIHGRRRRLRTAQARQRPCVVAWCMRGDALRVISLRGANARERKRYDET